MTKRFHICVLILLLTISACGPSKPTVYPAANLTPLSLPPQWTETTDIVKTPSPGWEVFTGTGVEMWLPESFEGGDPVQRREELIAMVQGLGPEYQAYIQAVEESPTRMVFIAFDFETSGTIVGVTKRDVPQEITLEEYVVGLSDSIVEQVPGSSIVERSTV